MSICIECAVGLHDFKEILQQSPDRGSVSSAPVSPEAWIDGKRHRLDRVGSYHVPCDHCRRVKSNLFRSAED